ncbi:hypothetical protein PT286_07155 [Neisseriaceae bacterium ESL0693]|nr:hypothetical protein [Neisseriaceae bacterium ESL0693]
MIKKYCIMSLISVLFTACTPIERFTLTTQLPAKFKLTAHTAKLRLTTNSGRVFATPDANCIDLTQSGLISNENPRDKRDDLHFWSSKPPETKEFITQDLGVNGLSINQWQRFGFNPHSYSYISKDITVNADKPITIFIHKKGSMIGLFTDSIGEYSFGISFIPKANQQYQLMLENSANGNYTFYRARLLDVTDPQHPINITHLSKRSKGCKKH